MTPSCMFGQRNSPSSSRLANRQTPVPSQKISLPGPPVSPGTHRRRRRTDRTASLRAPAPPSPRRLCGSRRLGRHHHPDRACRTDHAPAFKARSTTATVFASAPRPIRTVTPSISTSMLPQLRLAWPSASAAEIATGDGTPLTIAGTNCGACSRYLTAAGAPAGARRRPAAAKAHADEQPPKRPRPEQASLQQCGP